MEEYAARHGSIPLTPLTTTFGNAGVLGETASAKYQDIRRSEAQENENDEPQWPLPDNIHDDVTTGSLATQKVNTFNLAATQLDNTANMPPKITLKLKSATTKALEGREASEKAGKAMKHKFSTAENIHRDMLEVITEGPERLITPNGGHEFQKNLHAELRMGKSPFPPPPPPFSI